MRWNGTPSNQAEGNVAAATAAAHDNTRVGLPSSKEAQASPNSKQGEKETGPRDGAVGIPVTEGGADTEQSADLQAEDLGTSKEFHDNTLPKHAESITFETERGAVGETEMEQGAAALIPYLVQNHQEGELLITEEWNNPPRHEATHGKVGEGQNNTVVSNQQGKEMSKENITTCEENDERGNRAVDNSGTSRLLTGEGDLSILKTTMAWSPGKKVGLKRNLEAMDSEEESESGNEEEEGELARRPLTRNKEEGAGNKRGTECEGAATEGVAAPERKGANTGAGGMVREVNGKAGATAPEPSTEAGTAKGREAPVGAEPGSTRQSPMKPSQRDPS